MVPLLVTIKTHDSLQSAIQATLQVVVGFVVEVTGVEPVSESRRHYLSPSTVHVLRFPQVHAHEQAYTLGSFMNTPLAQSFARLRVPL